jgi:uncharacterized protein (TIGR02466 family)
MDILGLFPIAVTTEALKTPITTEMRSFIHGLDKKITGANSNSVNGYILDEKIFAEVKTLIESALNTHFDKVYHAASDDNSLFITQSWATYTHPGEAHLKHFHYNSILSGVLYIDVTGDDNITFYNSTKMPLLLDIKMKEFGPYNSYSWKIGNITSGDLIIFPSYLEHMVETTTSSTTRVGISFNSFIKGTVGSTGNGRSKLIL